MAITVHYIAKNGKAERATFPTMALASSYAKSVKGARFEDSSAPTLAVNVTKCPEGTADAQRAASKAYHDSWRNDSSLPVGSTRGPQEDTSESRAERMAEHFGASLAAGQSREDAWSDWDYVQGRP